MTDPLSIGTGAAGLISLGLTVTSSLVDFYQAQKGRQAELRHILKKLQDVTENLSLLDEILARRNFSESELSLKAKIEKSIDACNDAVQELQEESEKFKEASADNTSGKIKTAARKATYPFRQSTLQKLDENVADIRDNLCFALDTLQIAKTQSLQDDSHEIKSLLELVRANQISKELNGWLRAPDVFSNHHKACTQKHPGTGRWLTNGAEFQSWLTSPNSFLWLNGFAGSGKSVLCSTAVQYTLRHRSGDAKTAIAFFYFAFDDNSKQDESAMIRALLLQLSNQLNDDHKDLSRLHDQHNLGLPPSMLLLDYLRRFVQSFRRVYMFLDAVDECPSTGQRERVLDTIERIRGWGQENLHFCVTSRNLPDISDVIGSAATQQISMRNADVEKDIAEFIAGQLREDRRLKKLSDYYEKIEKRLAKDCKGVFRWVECQLRALQGCPRSEYHVDRFLNSLPQGLDETYERMLCNIEPALSEDARRIFTLVCFAPRPMSVSELLDGIAVNLDEPRGFDRDRRLQDFQDICGVCPGFLEIYEHYTHLYEDKAQKVRIAHFSIQEYLESGRLQSSKAVQYAMDKATAHAEITEIMLLYILDASHCVRKLAQTTDLRLFVTSERFNKNIKLAYPLVGSSADLPYTMLSFALEYWIICYNALATAESRLEEMVLEVATGPLQIEWKKRPMAHPRFNKSKDPLSDIENAALLGLNSLLSEHLRAEHEKSNATSVEFIAYLTFLRDLSKRIYRNSHKATKETIDRAAARALPCNDAEFYHTLLDAIITRTEGEAPSLRSISMSRIVQCGEILLTASQFGVADAILPSLNAGATLNFEDQDSMTAVQLASFKGHKEVLQILLDAGADVDSQQSTAWSGLLLASFLDQNHVLPVLIDAGADLNAQDDISGKTALHYAASKGHTAVVKTLIGAHADLHARNKRSGKTALHYAASKGHAAVVEILIKAHEDLHARYDRSGKNALHHAASKGHAGVIQILIGAHVDLHARNDRSGKNALHYAASEGHTPVLHILIEARADLHARDKKGMTALFTAREKAAKMLREAGADIDARNADGLTILQWAVKTKQNKKAYHLIGAGADLMVLDDEGKNLLHLTSEPGSDGSPRTLRSDELLQTLIDLGVNIDHRDRVGRSPLYTAIERGQSSQVRALIGNGADVDAPDAEGRSPLKLAADIGDSEARRYLMLTSANVNTQDRHGMTPLHISAAKRDADLMRTLIDAGANVNVQDCHGTTPLHISATDRSDYLIRALIDAGADMYITNNEGRNPLHIAVIRNNAAGLLAFLDAGADVGIRDSEGLSLTHLAVAESYYYHFHPTRSRLSKPTVEQAEWHQPTARRRATLRVLKNGGADINSQNNGKTPLHIAVAEGYTEIAQLLMAFGADLNMRDHEGKTALDYVSSDGTGTMHDTLRDAAERRAVEPDLADWLREMEGERPSSDREDNEDNEDNEDSSRDGSTGSGSYDIYGSSNDSSDGS